MKAVKTVKTLSVIVELGELHGTVVDAMQTFDEALQEMQRLHEETGKQYQIYYSELEEANENEEGGN